MANWSAEDSNLNTICPYCLKSTVPLLTINILQKGTESCAPFSIPYLNPLVLRKELENVLTQEGDLSLSEAKFIEDHPIIYWNLVWTFERVNVQSHLPNLYLKLRNGNKSENFNNIDISCENKSNFEEGFMQPVEEGADPLTQVLVIQGIHRYFFIFKGTDINCLQHLLM